MGEVLVALAGAVATITLSAPQRNNALNVAMWRALRNAALLLNDAANIRVVVIRGAGSDFAAGADIGQMPAVRHDRASGIAYHEDVIRPALQALLDCDKALIAAIDGYCVGGGLEIAACCDIRFASERAQLGAPVLHRGFPLAPFEMDVVCKAFGTSPVMSLLMSGSLLDGARAFALGMVHELAASAQFESRLDALTRRVAAAAPLAVRTAKQLARGDCADPWAFLQSSDYTEGIMSFVQKRNPVFKGS
jgi:enoyl-CoA hydratase